MTNEIKEAITEALELVYFKQLIKDELLKAVNELEAKNDRWITLKPHGKEADDYKRLLIKDGEDIEDAMHRQGYYNKRQAKTEKEESNNYEKFHKSYYKDNNTSWTFEKHKGGTYSVTRYDERGNYVATRQPKKFEQLDKYINQFNVIKLDIPKRKIKGKNEFQEDLTTLKSFEDKGFKVTSKYDDGYNVKYVLEKEKKENNTNSAKQEIENLVQAKQKSASEYLQAIKDYKKAERKYEKTGTKADYDAYAAAAQEVRDKIAAYNENYNNVGKYVSEKSKPLAKNADIAGAKQGKPMTFKEANGNNANPEYLKNPNDEKYNRNCQSCVLAYEARRRGYDVKATARNEYDKTALLAQNSAASFIDKSTGKPCEYEIIKPTNSANLYNMLNNKIKKNERYFFRYTWFDGKDSAGHVVTLEKDENENLAIYDAQTGRRKYEDEMKTYFKSYLQFNGKSQIGLLRVDDKELNDFFVNDGVLEKN